MQGNVQTIALPSYVGGVGGHRVELLTFAAFGMWSVLFCVQELCIVVG